MNKILLTGILALGCLSTSFAQTDSPVPSNEKTEKIFEHTIGVQMNTLIRQVFNFNNSTTTPSTNVSPYLGTYNINLRKTGWGLRVGVGYNYQSLKTGEGTPVSSNTDISDLQFRIGIEKAFKLSNKWSAGAGLDFVYSTNNDNTTAVTVSFDTITTKTKDVISNYGGGPMAWLHYHLTDKILIGTETSFYYTQGKEKQDLNIHRSDSFIPDSDSKTDHKVGNGTFTLPIAIYLMVKF